MGHAAELKNILCLKNAGCQGFPKVWLLVSPILGADHLEPQKFWVGEL